MQQYLGSKGFIRKCVFIIQSKIVKIHIALAKLQLNVMIFA